MNVMSKDALTLEAEMFALGRGARDAAAKLRDASTATKNKALIAAADAIRAHQNAILAANAEDVKSAASRNLSPALMDRLKLDAKRVEATAKGVADVAALADPVGRELARWTMPNGLDIARVATPIGVLGIIYESRPNVTADAGALCIKSGNAAILRGGSESFHSSRALHAALVEGLEAAGLPGAAIQLVPTTDRAAVGHMLAGLGGAIELIIPRGGKSLVARVQNEARVPVLAHLEGVCHTYVHEKADLEKARALVLNGKMRRTGICGATETMLIDASIIGTHLTPILDDLANAGCEIRGDARVRAQYPRAKAGDRRGLAHRISRRDHRGARGRRRGRGDPPYRDLWLAAHRVDRHRRCGRGGAVSCPGSIRRSSCTTRRRSSPMAASSAWARRSASARASCMRAGPWASSSSPSSNMSCAATARRGREEKSPYKDRLDSRAGAGGARIAHRPLGRLVQSAA